MSFQRTFSWNTVHELITFWNQILKAVAWGCSVKELLESFSSFTRKHSRMRPFFIKPVTSFKVTLILVYSHESYKTFHYIAPTNTVFWIGWRQWYLAKYLAVILKGWSKWTITSLESTIKTLDLGKVLLNVSNKDSRITSMKVVLVFEQVFADWEGTNRIYFRNPIGWIHFFDTSYAMSCHRKKKQCHRD